MSYCWLRRAGARPDGALAWARLWTLEGAEAGGLAAWAASAGASVDDAAAVKIDARAVDPTGPAGYASLTWAPEGSWLPFDDVAVSGSIRRVLAGPSCDLVSALSQSDSRFLGALVGVVEDEPDRARVRLADDPFALLFPRRLLRVDAGLLGRAPTAVGPSMQRYGAGSPWPWDRFPGPTRTAGVAAGPTVRAAAAP